MTEATKRKWDVRLGIIAPILTCLTILIGVVQFNVGEENKVRLEYDLIKQKDTVEFNRKLWLERLNAYRSIAELAGKIIAHTDDAKLSELVRDFSAAYWGTMILVEDKPVEQAMIRFYVEINDFQSGWSDIRRLKVRADELIEACRKSEQK
jgi:hypothetical protein